MIQIEKFKSGNFVQQLGYKSFQPEKMNATYRWEDTDLTRLNDRATLALGQLDAYAHLVPNVDHFIRMYVTKEALVSSKIEGTQTNMEEALLKESQISPEQRHDWNEVNNYINAMNNALTAIETLPLSSRLLKLSHHDLLQGVRGEHKLPGEFRKSQNWIGGSSLNNASFVPPLHQEVNNLMGDLENFLHNEHTGLSQLMKIALAHYQFETIHPFLDGNGRIGRLMITLFLVEQGVLKKPVLYLSDYFEKNRVDYYDNLTRVREKHDLVRWLKFFIKGVEETCTSAINSLKDILALKQDCEEKRIYQLGKKVTSAKLLMDYLYNQPIIDVEDVVTATGISSVSAYKLIDDFEKLGILKELTGYKRNRVFAFDEYFSIFKK